MSLAARRTHLALTIAGCFGAGSLYGWSGYLPAVRADFGVNNASASMVFSLALVSFTIGVLLGPALLARVPPHLRLPLIAGLGAVSLAIAATSSGFALFAMAYGVSFGFTSGVLYNFAVSLASASDRPTLWVPVSVATFGLGGALIGPVHVWLTDAGWALWSIAPGLACLSLVCGASLVLTSPKDTAAAPQNKGLTVIRPNKTLAILWVIFAAGSCSGLIVLGFAAQFLSPTPQGVGLASLAVFLVASGNTLGRLSSAWTAARFGPTYGVAGALTLSVFTLACLVFATAPGVVVGLLCVVAFAYGQLAATTPLLVKAQVGAAQFSTAFGWVFTGWGVAGLAGPWTAGWLLDATGTFQYSLTICICLAALSLWLVFRLSPEDRAAEEC
ncbi:MAG: hypothetical protein AAGF79_04625 [Pseudomonadota bacterium]